MNRPGHLDTFAHQVRVLQRVAIAIQCLANRRFQFHESDQFFIRTHNETPSVVAMRVGDPACRVAVFLRKLSLCGRNRLQNAV
jgi:hypothetical protein